MICEHSFRFYVEKDMKYSVMYFKNGLTPNILHMAKLLFPSVLPDPYCLRPATCLSICAEQMVNYTIPGQPKTQTPFTQTSCTCTPRRDLTEHSIVLPLT